MSENKNSKARIAANNRYNQKAYDRINIAIRKEKGALIRSVAQAQGMSVNAFIVGLIDKELERLEVSGVISIFSKEDTNTF